MSKRDQPPAPAPVVVPGYVIGDRIGAGGFSVVYRARQLSMNREVAVKVLNAGFETAAEQRAFERECHAIGRLSSHPHIVTVFGDAMTEDQRPCIVMELYTATYRERVTAEGALPIAEVLSTGVHIADALQVAHDHNVLHRDIKPHNIFVSQYGAPALGDFGISTLDDERSAPMASGLSVAYAAPEVLEDSAVGRSSDVYALAATLYHLAAGESPFASADLRTTVRRILAETAPTLSRPDAPPGLARVLARAMAKDPADRPATARDLAEGLREVQARMGVGRTAMISGTPAAPEQAPAPLAPPGAPAAPPDVAPPALVPETDDGADVAGGTVPRARRVTTPEPEPVDDGPDRRRIWIGLGAAIAAVIALVVAAGVLGGGDDDTDPTTPTTVRRPDDLVILAAPSDVEVTRAATGFEVTFDVTDEVERVEITIVSGDDAGRLIPAEGSPVAIESTDASLCVTARAIGADGRVNSADSEPVCSG